MKSIRKNFSKKMQGLFLLALVYLLFYCITSMAGINCIWRYIFGIPCPGCGFTRSVIAMISLDFREAWKYHPMFWSSIYLGLFFLKDGTVFKNKRINTGCMFLFIAGIIGTWIVRIVTGSFF